MSTPETDEGWLQRMSAGEELSSDVDRAIAVIQAADELVRYMYAARVVDVLGRATNPANAANLRDALNKYIKARGRGL